MKDYVLKNEGKYSYKRRIIHFMQPHPPFIKDLDINKFNSWGEWIFPGQKFDIDRLYRAYKRNLKETLPHVYDLVRTLGGKTTITSDHGEAFGERLFPLPFKVLGHPPYVRIPSLVRVPWLAFDK